MQLIIRVPPKPTITDPVCIIDSHLIDDEGKITELHIGVYDVVQEFVKHCKVPIEVIWEKQ